MKFGSPLLFSVFSTTTTLLMGSPAHAHNACSALINAHFGQAHIIETEQLSSGDHLSGLNSLSKSVAVSRSFCRIRGKITPTPASDIRFEVWLPTKADWNGRYLGAGNGGNAGSFHYREMMNSLRGGYAVSGTDTGHVGSAFDSSYAYGHPEQLIDFGWRAIHLTAVASKAVIQAG